MSAARRVLVTGASRGIGAAIAAVFADAGDTVVVHCRAGLTDAEAVVAGLAGSGHAVVRGDLGRPDQAARVMADAVGAVGGVDVLVNNAAIYEERPVDTTAYADWQASWRRTFEVNVLGPADLAWCLVDHLLQRPEGPAGGALVTVGSRGAHRGEPLATAYGASKAAVTAMTQSLAVALAPHGITAAAVAPGFVGTDMAAEVLAGPRGDGIRAQSPFGRVADPAEIAAAVWWLASPAARWASGTVLDCNGASYLR